MRCDHPECEAMRDRVAWLESELGYQQQAEVFARLRDAISVNGTKVGRAQSAMMVAALYAADGRVMSRYQILEAVPSPSRKEDRTDNIVAVWATHARKSLGVDAIANVWGRGYRLTPEGMERVRLILQPREAA